MELQQSTIEQLCLQLASHLPDPTAAAAEARVLSSSSSSSGNSWSRIRAGKGKRRQQQLKPPDAADWERFFWSCGQHVKSSGSSGSSTVISNSSSSSNSRRSSSGSSSSSSSSSMGITPQQLLSRYCLCIQLQLKERGWSGLVVGVCAGPVGPGPESGWPAASTRNLVAVLHSMLFLQYRDEELLLLLEDVAWRAPLAAQQEPEYPSQLALILCAWRQLGFAPQRWFRGGLGDQLLRFLPSMRPNDVVDVLAALAEWRRYDVAIGRLRLQEYILPNALRALLGNAWVPREEYLLTVQATSAAAAEQREVSNSRIGSRGSSSSSSRGGNGVTRSRSSINSSPVGSLSSIMSLSSLSSMDALPTELGEGAPSRAQTSTAAAAGGSNNGPSSSSPSAAAAGSGGVGGSGPPPVMSLGVSQAVLLLRSLAMLLPAAPSASYHGELVALTVNRIEQQWQQLELSAQVAVCAAAVQLRHDVGPLLAQVLERWGREVAGVQAAEEGADVPVAAAEQSAAAAVAEGKEEARVETQSALGHNVTEQGLESASSSSSSSTAQAVETMGNSSSSGLREEPGPGSSLAPNRLTSVATRLLWVCAMQYQAPGEAVLVSSLQAVQHHCEQRLGPWLEGLAKEGGAAVAGGAVARDSGRLSMAEPEWDFLKVDAEEPGSSGSSSSQEGAAAAGETDAAEGWSATSSSYIGQSSSSSDVTGQAPLPPGFPLRAYSLVLYSAACLKCLRHPAAVSLAELLLQIPLTALTSHPDFPIAAHHLGYCLLVASAERHGSGSPWAQLEQQLQGEVLGVVKGGVVRRAGRRPGGRVLELGNGLREMGVGVRLHAVTPDGALLMDALMRTPAGEEGERGLKRWGLDRVPVMRLLKSPPNRKEQPHSSPLGPFRV